MARSKTNRPKRRRRPNKPAVATSVLLTNKIQAALRLHQSGQLEAAKEIYCDVLSQDPNLADAWHLLGMALYSGGVLPSALECLEKAVSLDANQDDYQEHLALVLHSMGKRERALPIFMELVGNQPENVSLRNNFGVFLLENQQLPEAEEQFSMVLELDPTFEQAKMNLANCWVRQHRLIDAESCYRELLKANGKNLDVLGNLGECLRRQCKWDEAIGILRRVVQLRPEDLVSRLTLGRTLVNQGRLGEAADEFKSILADHPKCVKAHQYLGNTLLSQGEVKSAYEAIEQALKIDPGDAHAMCSLGFVCIELDRRDEAATWFHSAVERLPGMAEAHGCLLYLMTGDPAISPKELFAEHVRWGELHAHSPKLADHRNDPSADRRLRIGYLSADFREHAVSVFFEPLLRLCDRSQFETFCYFQSGIEDHVTRKLKSMSDHWRVTLGYSDDQVARMIFEDEIDIMVDLSGHTSGNRLTALARKPAPVQISWLGYPNTTGMKAIDYCLTCEVQNPPDEPSLHVERLIRIPDGSFCFSPPGNAPPVAELPASRTHQITFGSLHRPFKISSITQDLWAAALHAVPESRLLAFNTRFNSESKSELIQALVDRGIDSSRIEVRNVYSGESYLVTYDEIDIGLDASPWAGGTTTMEALWMGVPVIAFYGRNRPSRGTAGIVHHLGKPHWIARSVEEYANKVHMLASDRASLAQTRATLREMTRRTIADEQRFVSQLEDAYRDCWYKWCTEVTTT